MEQQALQEAREIGRRHGNARLRDGLVIGVVDVVNECNACGEWLDTLVTDPHAFNEAHTAIWQAYSAGYNGISTKNTIPMPSSRT